MTNKRIIGLDLGNKTLGIAISDPLEYSAQGLTTIRFDNNHFNKAIALLKDTLNDIDIALFVLGYPLHMNGDESESSIRSINFKKKLIKEFNKEVVLWDERLSSVMVDKIMIDMNIKRNKRKAIIDEMAAINILQGYLDARK